MVSLLSVIVMCLHDVDIAGSDANYVDVTDLGSLDIITPAKCLINLAVEHRDDVSPVSRYDDVNVLGPKIYVRFVERGIQKIIFTSSVAIYGFAPPDTTKAVRLSILMTMAEPGSRQSRSIEIAKRRP